MSRNFRGIPKSIPGTLGNSFFRDRGQVIVQIAGEEETHKELWKKLRSIGIVQKVLKKADGIKEEDSPSYFRVGKRKL